MQIKLRIDYVGRFFFSAAHNSGIYLHNLQLNSMNYTLCLSHELGLLEANVDGKMGKSASTPNWKENRTNRTVASLDKTN